MGDGVERMDIRQAWMGALLLCRMYTYGNRGVWEERWAGRLLRESEILLGRWRNIGPGGKLRWMHLCTVFSNYIQVDFSCRIPCLTTIPFVIPPPSAFHILIVERPSIHMICFSKLRPHRNPVTYCQHSPLLFSTNVSGAWYFPRRYALQFNVLALADRF